MVFILKKGCESYSLGSTSFILIHGVLSYTLIFSIMRIAIQIPN